MSLPIEESWRPVPGYEGLYEVSNQGRVRGLIKRKILRQFTTAKGYRKLHLYRDDGGRDVRVHRIVLEAFDRPPRDGEVARHLNGDSQDNRIENLAWGTVFENAQDMVRHGRHARKNRTHCSGGHSYAEHATHFTRTSPKGATWNLRRCNACRRSRPIQNAAPEAQLRSPLAEEASA